MTINILQFLPIILAIAAIVLASIKVRTIRRKQDLVATVLSAFAAILLIVAQTSWWEAAILRGDLVDTWFANQIWLIFNTLTMVVFILNSAPRITPSE